MKVRRIDFWPDEWLAGTAELTWAERGVYITACAMIYSRGGPIGERALYMHCRPEEDPHRHAARSFKRSFDRLIALGKLYRLDDGKISQKRCELELWKSTQRIERAEHARASRGSDAPLPRHDRAISAPRPRHLNGEKRNDINGNSSAISPLTSNYQLTKKERGERSNFMKGISVRADARLGLKQRKRDLLLQKLIRFANATMSADTATSAIAGLMADDSDEAKRWFDLLDAQMRQCGWNDH